MKRHKEKRRHRRIPIGLTMVLRIATGRVRGTIIDLSAGGMTFQTTTELEEGAILVLKTNLPLEIRGEVRHLGRTGKTLRYGVRFHRVMQGIQKPRARRFTPTPNPEGRRG